MNEDYGIIDQTGATRGELSLSSEATGYLLKAAKWARFLSIVAMVSLGIILLAMILGGSAFVAGITGGSDDPVASSAGFGIGMLLFYGAFLVFGLYLYYLLYSFSSNTIKAVRQQSSNSLTVAFQNLGRYYMIMGIVLAIYMVLMVLGILSVFFVGVGSYLI